MKRYISGWGRHATIEANIYRPNSIANLRDLLAKQVAFIPRGNGRSYGDSAMATNVTSMLNFNCFSAFDPISGQLSCEAGVLLADIINSFSASGWFLPVTAGTKYISVAGAIASDIHGKNHHHVGCFSEFVESFDLLLANGEIITCSNTQHPKIFHATCGGMGLTGIILRARLKLIKVSSTNICQTVIKARHLDEIIELFTQHGDAPYSVAWIDCCAKGKNFGRSLLMLGEHAADRRYVIADRTQKKIPVRLLANLLNRHSIKLFNSYYYHRPRSVKTTVDYNAFFYPLDHIAAWNRMYGKSGFIQYQFVIPNDRAKVAMKKIVTAIVDYGRGSFLAVLKRLGASNNNLLSFPCEGLTLALDFKIHHSLFAFLRQLDHIVCEHGGRVYLSKDACVDANSFATMYHQAETLRQLRAETGADRIFHSLQSRRLNL